MLRSAVKRLMALEVPKQTAINTVASEHSLDPKWVAELVDFGDGLAGREA